MIVSKQKIIETYETIHCLHQNEVKRFAEVAKRTGAPMDDVVNTILELKEYA